MIVAIVVFVYVLIAAVIFGLANIALVKIDSGYDPDELDEVMPLCAMCICWGILLPIAIIIGIVVCPFAVALAIARKHLGTEE